MKYYLIAGEASGDLHGSNLMRGLYARDPEADIRFWGGGLMDAVYQEHQQGSGLVRDYREGAVMGIWEVFVQARKLLKRVRSCEEDIRAWKPDVVVLIDYPGFNFRIAEFAHQAGFKVFWYIAPKVWASRESRIKKLKAYVDRLFIVFPFEIDYFRRKGVDFIYRGNPLIDAVDRSPALQEPREAFLTRHGLPDQPFVALLAGSRSGEIKTMMPVLTDFAARLHKLPQYADYQFVIAAAPGRTQRITAPFRSMSIWSPATPTASSATRGRPSSIPARPRWRPPSSARPRSWGTRSPGLPISWAGSSSRSSISVSRTSSSTGPPSRNCCRIT